MSAECSGLGTPSQRVELGEDEGHLALLIDGVVQSVALEGGPLDFGYWPLMLPQVRPRAALLLGYGGGTIGHLLVQRFGPIAITAVERDPEVARLAESSFGLPGGPFELVIGDAFAFVAATSGTYDYIAVDLFAEDTIPKQVLSRPFLKRLKALLAPGGLMAMNLFKDRRVVSHQHRLETVFPRVDYRQDFKNVVALCHPR